MFLKNLQQFLRTAVSFGDILTSKWTIFHKKEHRKQVSMREFFPDFNVSAILSWDSQFKGRQHAKFKAPPTSGLAGNLKIRAI